jgi:hypothetical protein
MEKLELVEVERNNVVHTIDYEPIKLEMMRIQNEISRDALKQRRTFFFGNMKFLLSSLVVYSIFIFVAWAKYKQ